MKTVAAVVTILILVGCALSVSAQTTIVTPAPAVVTPAPVVVNPTPGKYSGAAWTWDSRRNIVTLYDSGRTFRVQVTPDQIARLRHHEWATVNGVLLPPEPIDTVLLPAQPMVAQPAGAPTTAEISGRVAALDPNGVAVIESARGPLRVWVADGAANRFAPGRAAKVHVTVQPVRMVAVAGGGGLASGPTLAASTTPVPGDQAVVVGRVISITSTGMMSVESPRGPMTVWVPDAANFKSGDYVQVQTIVQPG